MCLSAGGFYPVVATLSVTRFSFLLIAFNYPIDKFNYCNSNLQEGFKIVSFVLRLKTL